MPKYPTKKTPVKKVAGKATAKKAAVKTPPTPPWMTQTVEARLCRLADSLALPEDVVAQSPQYLKRLNLKTSDITPEVVAKARALERQWTAHLKEKTQKLNGIWGTPTGYAKPKD